MASIFILGMCRTMYNANFSPTPDLENTVLWEDACDVRANWLVCETVHLFVEEGGGEGKEVEAMVCSPLAAKGRSRRQPEASATYRRRTSSFEAPLSSAAATNWENDRPLIRSRNSHLEWQIISQIAGCP
jgi:hypothetical protein